MNYENVYTEKYRPKTLDDIIGQKNIVKCLKGFVANQNMPNLIFIGPAGVGKTTSVLALAKEMYGEHWKQNFFELNASDEGGVNVMRTKIKNFAESTSVGFKFKTIFLDESDYLCLTGDTEVLTGSLANPKVRKIKDITDKRFVMIPSVNPDTLELENDKGRLVDSGHAGFFRIVLENKSIIKASPDHPFFKIQDGHLVEIKLRNLEVGDEIVELRDKVFNKCPICSKYTLNKLCCSVDCQNKMHSARMQGSGNSMYGNTWTSERREKIVSKLSDGRLAGKNNPNYGGIWYGSKWFEMNDSVKKRVRKRLSDIRKGKTYEMLFGTNHIEERIKRHPNSSRVTIETDLWIKKKLNQEYTACEDCGRRLKTSGSDKDSVYTHHKDGNHSNHIQENIKFVCPKCHNMVEHNCKERFLEKGWNITHKKSVHNGIRIKSIDYIGIEKAWNLTMERNANFILGNGVVTHNTREAQAALRRTIEKTSHICRYVFSCNFPDKIIEPISDRCSEFRFSRLHSDDVSTYIKKVSTSEEIAISDSAVTLLAEKSGGSMRRPLNLLQTLKLAGISPIGDKEIMEFTYWLTEDDLQPLMQGVISKSFRIVDGELKTLLFDKGFSKRDIILILDPVIKKSSLPPQVKIDAVEFLSTIDFRISVGSTPITQLRGLFARIMKRL